VKPSLFIKYGAAYAAIAFLILYGGRLIPQAAIAPYLGAALRYAYILLLYPLAIALPFSFAGGLLKEMGHRGAGEATRRLLYYPLLLYMVLYAALSSLGHLAAFWPLYLLILSIPVYSASSIAGPLSSAVKWLAGSVALYSIYLSTLILYPAAAYAPFWAFVGSLAFAAVSSLGILRGFPRDVSYYVGRILPRIFLIYLALLAISSLMSIPSLSVLRGYVLLSMIAVFGIAIAYAALRIYRIGTGYAERIAETIYGQHAREVRLVGFSEDDPLYSAAIDFIRNGDKDGLLVLLAHLSCSMGEDYRRTREMLAELMRYSAPDIEYLKLVHGAGRIRRIVEEDAMTRRGIVERLLGAAPGPGGSGPALEPSPAPAVSGRGPPGDSLRREAHDL